MSRRRSTYVAPERIALMRSVRWALTVATGAAGAVLLAVTSVRGS